MQENWIGKSEGVRFAFPHDIRDAAGQAIQGGRLYVFTTRADTIMGVTFAAVAPEHPLAAHAAQQDPKLAAFIEEAKRGGTTEAELALKDKEGVPTGLSVTHPLTRAQVPVWVGNYVLMSYGDGAVMGVPAHDERDFAFAKKYGLDIKPVIAVEGQAYSTQAWAEWYGDKQRGRCIASGKYDGLAHAAAVDAVATDLIALGLGEKKTTWRLRDWGVSRQRYWGTPIPIIHCAEHGAVPVPEQDLPVVLPEDCIPDGSGNPLNKRADFLAAKCPVCGKDARRETDTMDTFVDSAWYYMRYCDPTLETAMVGAGTQYWMPMDQYIGGIEHAILHLLYARFWTKVMRDIGLVKVDEPFTKLLTQGMVLNEAYSRTSEQAGREYFWANELDIVRDEHAKVVSATARRDGQPVVYEGWTTMSKSKNNGVDPQQVIDQYGADTARLFVMFASPPEQTVEWNDAGVKGAHSFLTRVWQDLCGERSRIRAYLEQLKPGQALWDHADASQLDEDGKRFRRQMHLLLKQVSYDFDRLQYNTVVSGCMKLLNLIGYFQGPRGVSGAELHARNVYAMNTALSASLTEAAAILLRVLYPVCPHITYILWRGLGYAEKLGDLLDAPWPAVDDAALVQDELELVLQVNGKHRGSITVPASADKDAIEALAQTSAAVARFTEGRPIKKVIVVPGRLVNVVA